MTVDNVIVHYYPLSPFIAKAEVNFRYGKKIVLRSCMKDVDASLALVSRLYPDVEVRVITHC